MRSLVFNIYRQGEAGLSNLIMSLELGILISALTDRVLILRGNKTPPANVVQYDHCVTNAHKSRVTDLMDIGIPWIDIDQVDITGLLSHEVCDRPAWQSVYYAPENLSILTDDFQSFANGRENFFTIGKNLQDIPLLTFSGGPQSETLSYYSYFFYFDYDNQHRAETILKRIKPKNEYAEFSNRIAKELGDFNAVHIRRGDFKVTLGVTTLERKPGEVVAILDEHFKRDDLLVIVTDEANDPFLNELKLAYQNHLFVDLFILENFEKEFLDLPQHDSIALAYISQLVAAHSQDFIGTMTSTFTGLIQRMRANAGKAEPFKYLWNEIPAPGIKVSPGRHAISNEIPLDKGVMIETAKGPYSWNRVNKRLNPAWMREWPESFLKNGTMLEKTLARNISPPQPAAVAGVSSTKTKRATDHFSIEFMGKTVTAQSNKPDIVNSIAGLFSMMESSGQQEAIGRVNLQYDGKNYTLHVGGKPTERGFARSKILKKIYRAIVEIFIYSHPELVWLHAGAACSSHGCIVLPGVWGRGKSTLTLELCKLGWLFMSDDIVPIEPRDGSAVPFPGTPGIRKADNQTLLRHQVNQLPKLSVQLTRAQVSPIPAPVSMIVFPQFISGVGTELVEVSPAQSAGKLLENCVSFPINSDETIQYLCSMVEGKKVYNLTFSDPSDAVQAMTDKLKRL